MTIALWTAAEAAAATGGQAIGDWDVLGISIDTRSLQQGDLFVALQDVRDGHDFVAQALKNGAGAALVSHRPDGVEETAPLLIVANVVKALEDMGRAARTRSDAKIVGVTGSVGKTSTKEMLRTVLQRQGKCHAAEKSFNNHWGVPITLAQMPQDTDFAVIEIGMNHPGEIAPLAALTGPDVALITTVAAAHMEAFENIEGIAHEKAAIFTALTTNGTAIYNADVQTASVLADAAVKSGAQISTFGKTPGSDYQLEQLTLSSDATVMKANANGQDVIFKLSQPAPHFALNALGVLAVVDALGADIGLAAADLAKWSPPAGRGTKETVQLDTAEAEMSIELIDDAFNANPVSMAAALEVLAVSVPVNGIGRIGKGRRIAILGDMLELGPEEDDIHRGLADHPAMASIDKFHCVGTRMKHLWDALPAEKKGEWAANADVLVASAHQLLDAGDVVLVKGSKGSYVSRVADAIRKLERKAEI
ncbi:MAG: UDP-N-acetylmuramoyl-tripeptide--D-alanyl-D-alanine ligase [Pseudoruegeria sp.]